MDSLRHQPRPRLALAIIAALTLFSYANAQQVALKGQSNRQLNVAQDLIRKSGTTKKSGSNLRNGTSGGKKKQRNGLNAQVALKKSRGAENDNGGMVENYQSTGSNKKNGSRNKKRGSGGRNQKKMNKRGNWSGSYKKKSNRWGSSTQGKSGKYGKSGKGQRANWSGGAGRKKNKNKWQGSASSGKSGKGPHYGFKTHLDQTYHPTAFPTSFPTPETFYPTLSPVSNQVAITTLSPVSNQVAITCTPCFLVHAYMYFLL
jgi:hypothetical protein